MIWLFLICLSALLVVLERHGARWSLERLGYGAGCDVLLAEPGQTLTLTSVVENQSPLPVLFLRLREYLPAAAQVLEDPAWMEDHVTPRLAEVCVEDAAFLLPWRRRTSRLHFSLPRRGWYRLGGATVEAGDFLGLREAIRREEARGEVVVIPERCEEPEALRTLGGFLGDVSVRRFILEDPVLTVGVREYTGREPMKDIAWKQSARAGRLLVKQYDYTVDQNVTVLFSAEGGAPAQLEACYRLVRTVCETLEGRAISYAFATNGDLIGPVDRLTWVAEGLGRQHLHTILYGLGRANCRCMGSLEGLVGACLGRHRPGQSYVLVTPPLSERQRALAERLGALPGASLCILTGEEGAQ